MNNTIYALPGFACSSKMYAPLQTRLLGSNYNFMSFDNWGFGELISLHRNSYSIKELAEYHWSLIDEKNLNQSNDLVLLGASMGGFIVQEMCAQRPSAVKSIIFLCTLGPSVNGFIAPLALSEEGLRAFSKFSSEERALFGTEGTVYPGLKEKNPEVYQSIYRYRLANISDVEDQVEQNKAAINYLNGSLNFEKISRIPTLCLHGENDRFVHPENAEILKSKFEFSNKTLIPESDHFFFMEKPDLVYREIDIFLKNNK